MNAILNNPWIFMASLAEPWIWITVGLSLVFDLIIVSALILGARNDEYCERLRRDEEKKQTTK